MTPNRLRTDETGLMGKITVVWLLIAALFVVAAFDGIAIAFTKYRVEDLAGNAASAAAIDYKQNRKAPDACVVAETYVAEHDIEAKIPQAGCVIDPATGVATITVRKGANTLVAQRLSFTRDLTHLESTESVDPPI